MAAAMLLAGILPKPASADDWTACDAAGTAAEASFGLPPGLLAAIGRVESGRTLPGSGRLVPWPWTINAAGKGQVFATYAIALDATRALLELGVASIDVGCFQVNLAYHPEAFGTLESAFDPALNAQAAARFLSTLRTRTGSWEDAIAAYHSATPERGGPYRQRVMAHLGRLADPATSLPARLGDPAAPVLREVAWTPTPGDVKVWTPSRQNAGPNVIRLLALPSLPLVRSRPGDG